MIEARSLSRSYGALLAVDEVSFRASPGEVVGLLGPNGAGKTTIMKILTGYHFPHAGSALIDGHDVVAEPIAAKRQIGYLAENTPLYDELAVDEYLEFVCGARGLRRAIADSACDRVIELCELQSVVRRPIGELSRGFRQRLGLAQALVHDPSVVILDEPTSGLDPNQIQSVRRIVKQLGEDKTVLFSTHILREVEAVCDRVLILDAGRIIASGTPSEIGGELRGRTSVEVKLDSAPDASSRSRLESVGRILCESSDASGVTLRLGLLEGSESDDVFDWAVRSGLRIRSLVPERYSLEEIFTELTSGGE